MNQHVDENFSLVVVDHKYRMADQLKKLYRVTKIFLPIFFDKDIPVLTRGTRVSTRGAFSREEPLIDHVIASAALY